MLANGTVAGVFRPCRKIYAGFYDISLIIVGSLLIGLCAQIKVWLPISPVPITGQTFAVLILGALLGSRRGSLCALAYIIEGTAGLSIFAAGAGPSVLSGPTGGYLAGFIPAAYITGRLAEMGWDRRARTTILAMILGNLCIYAFGLFWLSCLIGAKNALTTGLHPFLIGDCLKIALAAVLLPSGWKLLDKLKTLPRDK